MHSLIYISSLLLALAHAQTPPAPTNQPPPPAVAPAATGAPAQPSGAVPSTATEASSAAPSQARPEPAKTQAPNHQAQTPAPERTRDPMLGWLALIGAFFLAYLFLSRRRLAGLAEAPEQESAEAPAGAPQAETPRVDDDDDEDTGQADEAPSAPLEGLERGLAKTRNEGFVLRLSRLFGSRKSVDKAFIEELEELLFKADIGVKTTEKLIAEIKAQAIEEDNTDPDRLWAFIKERSLQFLSIEGKPLTPRDDGPLVILVVGVNGSGKTTTIGKLAQRYHQQGHRVLLAAGDTFRAAASDQLNVWATRVGVELVRGKSEADPSSVIYEALERAVQEKVDIVIADTAGRLHTKLPLMEELKKIHRVCGKALPGAPHEVLLVLDSTNGQNAIMQARDFHRAIEVSGVVLTKLDGTAKGGVILGICDELGLPVRFIGVGEQAEDLRVFSSEAFVEALFRSPEETS